VTCHKLLLFTVCCHIRRQSRQYVEVRAYSPQHAKHLASIIHPNASYRIVIPYL
jgi:hypothetical protein